MQDVSDAHNADLGTAMKLGMRRLASGVSVLSARTEEGERHAMTVSSVTSVSDTPPSLLVCVNRQLALEGHLSTLGANFAINILASHQRDISNLCAGFEGDKPRFALGNWQAGPMEIPYLGDAQASFFCETDQVTSYGTHHIIIGRILEVRLGKPAVDPLVYINGGYSRLQSD